MRLSNEVTGSIVSLYGVQMWVLIYGFGPINGPNWTVSTLFFFYLVFPRYKYLAWTHPRWFLPFFYLNCYGCRLLVYTQRKCNKQLCVLMALSFYLQFIIATLTPFITPGDDLTFLDYWVALCHPVSRLPVFFIGICAGLLCIRIQEGDLDAINGKTSYWVLISYDQRLIFL